MRKITRTKPFWIIISILLSFLLWLYVTATVTDEITRTFSGIPVEFVGEDILQDSKNMTITNLSTNTVSVAISGPRRVVSRLSADSLTAQIDVSKLSQSAYATMQYTISYPNGTDTSSLSVSRKVPETLNFQVDKLVTKEIPVRGSFDGSVAEGFTAESPIFEPSTILVTGAESYVNNISYAWVTFGVDEINSTYSEEATYTLNDEEGNELAKGGLTLSTDVVRATMPILMIKNVNLSVNLQYGAGATEENVTVTIDPEYITLSGDSSTLENLNKISLGNIDLTSFDQSYENVYTIPLDNGLSSISGEEEATVRVEISGLTTKTFKVTNIETTNVTDGFSAKINTSSLYVKVRGTEEALATVKESDIKAVVDLTDYNETTGEQVINAKVVVDSTEDVGAIGQYTVSILLERN